jgi:4-alpha-glucanotransferase
LRTAIRRLRCPVIVEDLGGYFPAAEIARQKLGVYGTRVWEFGWNGYPNNPHAVTEVVSDVAYYSSTHDLPPIRTWLGQRQHRSEVKRLHSTLGRRGTQEIAVTSVLEAPSTLAILAIADLLPRKVPPINTPGTSRGNWRWQLRSDDLTSHLSKRLRASLRASRRFLV